MNGNRVRFGWAIAIATAAAVGAASSVCSGQTRCCLPDGVCVDLPRGQCQARDGLFFEDGCVGCEPRGACCLTDRCVFFTPSWCAARGGLYQGDGVPCEEASCPTLGACCFESAQGESFCTVVTPVVCGRLNGAFQGLGTSCLTGGCVVTARGACCQQLLDEAFCEQLTPLGCTSIGGIYQGDGVSCDAVPCPVEPLGACCQPMAALQCFIATQRQCERGQFPRGIYGGDDSTCLDGHLCFGEVGACCIFNGCIQFTRVQCEGMGGVFQGADVDCGAVDCRPPCPCDLDDDGDADVIDLLAYLDRFFRRDGDFDGDGDTDIFDLLAFLTCLFRECP